MLTPKFNLTQNNDFLFVEINAPYTKVSEAEIFFADQEFRFYSKPYFLRLNLPGHVIENGEENATYNADKGSFFITVPKLQPGEYFDKLDLQTMLLLPKVARNSGHLIEVIGENSDSQNLDEEISWEVCQCPYTEPEQFIRNANYGFANQRNGVFTRLQIEIPDLIDVINPDQKSFQERKEERLIREKDDFNDNHYLADLYQDEEIAKVMDYEPKWEVIHKKDQSDRENFVEFTEAEKELMRKLPRKEYLLDQFAKQEVLFGLVDILFAYAYNARTTEGDNTVESAWTITKMSSTLSWLEKHLDMQSVVSSFFRRSLCYPLYRHWKLAELVLKDVCQILELGTQFVLKCFLEINACFSDSDPYYIMNDLYITDYCVWIQTIKRSPFSKISDMLKMMSISKCDMDLDLPNLEKAAEVALQEKLTEQIESDTSSENSDDTDSDDYVSSDGGETDSEDQSSDSENGLLLKEVKSVEKIR